MLIFSCVCASSVSHSCVWRVRVVARPGGLGELAAGCLQPIQVRYTGVRCLWSWLRTLARRGPGRSLAFPVSQKHGQWFPLNYLIVQGWETPNPQFFMQSNRFFSPSFLTMIFHISLAVGNPSQIWSQISRTPFTSVEGCQVTQLRTWLFYLSCSYHAYLSLSANFAWRFCKNHFSRMIQIFLVPERAGNTP